MISAATSCLHEQCTEAYPVEGTVKDPKFSNSDVLSSLDQKLGHLSESEQMVLKVLITKFISLFQREHCLHVMMMMWERPSQLNNIHLYHNAWADQRLAPVLQMVVTQLCAVVTIIV